MIIKTVFSNWLHPISAPQTFALNVFAAAVILSTVVVCPPCLNYHCSDPAGFGRNSFLRGGRECRTNRDQVI